MTSSAYKDENTIRGYMANTAHTQGESWELVKFFAGSSGVQRFVAKSGNKAVVAFRGTDNRLRVLMRLLEGTDNPSKGTHDL